MKQSWFCCRGMTLMELLISLALGASLSVAILQLFAGSMRIQSMHSAVQDLQHRTAYAQFLLRSGIYASASPCAPVVGMLSDQPGHPLRIFASHAAAPDALPESQVLRLRSSDCEAPAHFYYIGRRANDAENPAGLFRRRQRSDGSYQAAEELVEGVSAMTTSVGVTVCPEEPLTEAGTAPGCVLAYVDIDQLADWSDVFVVEITLSVQPLTDAVAQADAATDFPADGMTVQFSTALRHAEPHSSGSDS